MNETADRYVTSRVPEWVHSAIVAESTKTYEKTGVQMNVSSMVRAILTRALKIKKGRITKRGGR